jgi:hypothetical protein|tara:strand:- start:781 stop:1092 length:312 start_codon:yes stop_codon:yes gene_type:complete
MGIVKDYCMYSVLIYPENHRLHENEYRLLKDWFNHKKKSLAIDPNEDCDPMDPNHPFNRAFNLFSKEAELQWRAERNYSPSPSQLMHAFFQMEDPVRRDKMKA